MKYNKTTSCEKCCYAMWDSIYVGYGEDIDYVDGCEVGNKIFNIATLDNNNCKDYRSKDEISKSRID